MALTNNTTIGAYRGAGRPEATQLIERVLDVAASEIGMDPAEIRRVNFLQPESFPLTTPTGANYDSGEYEKALDAALKASGYTEPAGRAGDASAQQRRFEAARHRCLVVRRGHRTGRPARRVRRGRGPRRRHCDASTPARACTARATTTAFAMLASDVLGIPMDKITLVNSDTDRVPRGAGTMGSRSLQTAGSAIHVASNEVFARAQKIAAHLLEASPDDIVAGEGGVHVAGVPANALSWADLAVASRDASKLPTGLEPAPLRHELDFDGSDSTYPFGSHVSVVEVDTETGEVTMLRHVAVDDCGRILNPLLVNGQQHGGIAQGAAQALYEWMQYDERRQPAHVDARRLRDAVGRRAAAASRCRTRRPTARATRSARRASASRARSARRPRSTTPSSTRVSHLGVKHIDMPCTAERVWRAIQEASA